MATPQETLELLRQLEEERKRRQFQDPALFAQDMSAAEAPELGVPEWAMPAEPPPPPPRRGSGGILGTGGGTFMRDLQGEYGPPAGPDVPDRDFKAARGMAHAESRLRDVGMSEEELLERRERLAAQSAAAARVAPETLEPEARSLGIGPGAGEAPGGPPGGGAEMAGESTGAFFEGLNRRGALDPETIAEIEDLAEDPRTAKEKSLRLKKILRAIATGGAQIGRGLSGLTGVRMDDAGGVDTSAIDQSIAGLEEQLTPENDPNSPISQQARAMVEQATGGNVTVPEGASYNSLKQLYPWMADAAKTAAAGKEIPGEARGKPLAVGELKEIKGAKESINRLGRIMDELPKNLGAIGPLQSRVGKLAEFFGVADPKKAAFRRKITNTLNLYIKQMTGAQLSAVEAERLVAGLIHPKDSDIVFEAKLKDVIAEAKANYRTLVETYGEAGRDVTNFLEDLPGEGEASAPEGIDFVEVEDPDSGERKMIPRENLEEAKRRGWRVAGGATD